MSIKIEYVFDPNGNDIIYLRFNDEEWIYWKREWVEAMTQMQTSGFESYYRTTIRPSLSENEKALMESIDRQEIPLAFDRLRNYFLRQ